MEVADALELGGCHLYLGACSWADATLVKETSWYPTRSMKAAQRLAYYASRLPLVEVESTYYFPPTPELARGWVQRTPAGFRFDVRAWSLLTGHPTLPPSLWPDLNEEVLSRHRDKRRLYRQHLSPDGLVECWDRFLHALVPLSEADRLGGVLLQYPRWFAPSAQHRLQIAEAVGHLGAIPALVELRHPRWFEGRSCESTLTMLEDLGATFVCSDEPADPQESPTPVLAVTSDLAVLRFYGRTPVPAMATTSRQGDSFENGRYCRQLSISELVQWVPRIIDLTSSAREVHILMNNCWRDQAVVNAAQMGWLLQGAGASPLSPPVARSARPTSTSRPSAQGAIGP